jgi:hypothetical protein
MIFLEILLNVVRSRCLHPANESVVESFRGIDAGVSQEMVERDDFRNDSGRL